MARVGNLRGRRTGRVGPASGLNGVSTRPPTGGSGIGNRVPPPKFGKNGCPVGTPRAPAQESSTPISGPPPAQGRFPRDGAAGLKSGRGIPPSGTSAPGPGLKLSTESKSSVRGTRRGRGILALRWIGRKPGRRMGGRAFRRLGILVLSWIKHLGMSRLSGLTSGPLSNLC